MLLRNDRALPYVWTLRASPDRFSDTQHYAALAAAAAATKCRFCMVRLCNVYKNSNCEQTLNSNICRSEPFLSDGSWAKWESVLTCITPVIPRRG